MAFYDPCEYADHALVGNFVACASSLRKIPALNKIEEPVPRVVQRQGATTRSLTSNLEEENIATDEGPVYGFLKLAYDRTRATNAEGLADAVTDLNTAKAAMADFPDQEHINTTANQRKAYRQAANKLVHAERSHENMEKLVDLLPCSLDQVGSGLCRFKEMGHQKALSMYGNARRFAKLHQKYLVDGDRVGAALLLSKAAPGTMAWTRYSPPEHEARLHQGLYQVAMRMALGLVQPHLARAVEHKTPCGCCGKVFTHPRLRVPRDQLKDCFFGWRPVRHAQKNRLRHRCLRSRSGRQLLPRRTSLPRWNWDQRSGQPVRGQS